MAYINQGGLWDNQRKYEPNDPDFVGSINIAGVDHKIVAWMSSSKNKLAPTINIKVNELAKTSVLERPVPMDYSKTKEKEDDIPF